MPLLIIFICEFSAVPDAPGSLKVDDIDESSVTLMWSKPKNDGGKKIQGYVIEYKEISANRWKTYNDAPLKDTMATGEIVTCVKNWGAFSTPAFGHRTWSLVLFLSYTALS